MRSKALILLAAALFSGLSPVVALTCGHLDASQAELCTMINNLDATQQEKEALTTLAFYPNKTIPNHDFVEYWNTRLNTNDAPSGTSKQNSGIIKEAWIKILSVMPSVIEDNKLYCDAQGKLQSAYNYRVELPSGTASGDCKTNYALESNTAQLSTFVNNILIGHEKITSFSLTQSLQYAFKAQVNIETTTKIDHYKDRRYCCRRSNSGRCTRYCTSCDYDSTEHKTDSLVIEDTLVAYSYQKEPQGKVTFQDTYNGATKGTLTALNFTRFLFSVNASHYAHNTYIYDFVYGLPPYNIIILRATPFLEKSSRNINIRQVNASAFSFVIPNADNCKLQLFTHFHETLFNCNSLYEKKNISLKTDKMHYFVNDTIFVNIEPKNLLVNVTYGNTSIITQDSTSFIATSLYNTVTANYHEETVESLFSVTKKDRLVLASQIFLFYLINHVLVAFMTRTPWISRWLTVAYST